MIQVLVLIAIIAVSWAALWVLVILGIESGWARVLSFPAVAVFIASLLTLDRTIRGGMND